MRKTILCTTALALLFFLAAAPAFAQPKVPQYAAAVGRDLDRQLGGGLSLMVTTPVHIDDFRVSSTLARQMQEEIMTWLVKAGYNVQETRKACSLLFDENTGEFALTRKPGLLSSKAPSAAAVVTGTYTVTPYAVRFNIKVISGAGQDTLAMSSITVPITREVASLVGGRGLGDGTGSSSLGGGIPLEPTVVTRLP